MTSTVLTDKIDSVKQLKLGFLGLGWIGKNRMDSLIESRLAVPAVIADIDTNRARTSYSGISEICSGIDELISFKDLDGIVIATPSALHADQAYRALSAGFPVFCQKPLGRDLAEVSSVIAAGVRSNKLLGIDLSYRYLNAVQIANDLVKNNTLGEIYSVQAFFHNAYGPDKAWFYDPVLSGGGCVIDLGIHLVDLILYLLGFPELRNVSSKLYSLGKRVKGKSCEVEDYAVASMELDSGCSVELACSWRLNAGCDACIGVSMYGTEGGIAVRNVGGSFYDFRVEQYRGTATQILCNPPDSWSGRAIERWARRLQNDNSFDKSVIQAEKVALVLDSIYCNS